jgi:hypothetical protein
MQIVYPCRKNVTNGHIEGPKNFSLPMLKCEEHLKTDVPHEIPKYKASFSKTLQNPVSQSSH